MTPEQEKQVSVIGDEGVLLKLCLHLTLFYYEKEGEAPRWPAFLEILDEHNILTGNQYRWTVNPKTEKWKRLKNGLNSYIHPKDWLPTAKKQIWYLVYHAGEQASDASDIDFLARICLDQTRSPCYIQLQFPIDQFDGQHAGLPELAHKWCSLLRPEHGYGGFRLGQSHGYESGAGAVQSRLLSARFSGMDVGKALWDSGSLRKTIKGADWLTILSDHYVEKLGGAEVVKEGMGDMPIIPYNGGLILQAGLMPLVGDTSQQQDMTPYKQVARLVEPIRCKDHDGGFSGGNHGFTRELFQQWLARFSPQPE